MSKVPLGQVPPFCVTASGSLPQAYRGSVGGTLVPTSANAVNVKGSGAGPAVPRKRRDGAVTK